MSSQDEKSPPGKGLLGRAGVGSGGWKPGAIINQVKADRTAARAARASDAEQKAPAEGLAGGRRASRSRSISPLRPSSSDAALGARDQAEGSSTPTPGGSDTATGEVERRKSPVPTGWCKSDMMMYPARYPIDFSPRLTSARLPVFIYQTRASSWE